MEKIDNFFLELNDIFKDDSTPSVNVSDTKEAITIEVALPGLEKSDVNIALEDKILTISSEIKTENQSETKEESKEYVRREFSFNKFSRSFELPDSVDENSIKSKFENGILNINLPKKIPIEPIKKIITVE